MVAVASAEQRHGQGSIVTPEAVVLDFELAGVASRALSAGIDIAVQFAALFALAMLAGAFSIGSQVAAIVLLLLGLISIVIGYPVAMETLNRGRSLGRMAVGTRVVTIEGAPVRFRHSFIRSLLSIVDLFASSGAIAVVSALVTRRGQRLGDIVAGTMVIRERKDVGHGWSTPFFPAPQLAAWAKTVDTSALGDDGYRLIRDYLRRSDLSTVGSQLERDVESFVTGRLPLWPRPASVSVADWLRTIAAVAQGSTALAPPMPGQRLGLVPSAPPPPPSAARSRHQPPPPSPRVPPPAAPRPAAPAAPVAARATPEPAGDGFAIPG